MSGQGKVKPVTLANHCPALRKPEIEYYAMLAQTGVHQYSGSNTELGTAGGKHYRVCTWAIIDPRESDIIRNMPEQTGEITQNSSSVKLTRACSKKQKTKKTSHHNLSKRQPVIDLRLPGSLFHCFVRGFESMTQTSMKRAPG